jgi:rSAM/selenodomain-associated transferase 2
LSGIPSFDCKKVTNQLNLGVSVVIPSLNESANIALAVQSAWQAGATEVIVVDGGSSDGTQQLARTAQAKVIEALPGRAVQQNVGAAAATCDVLVFLHADCQLGPDCIRQIHSAIASGGKHGAFRQSIHQASCIYRLIEWGNNLRVTWMAMPYGDQGIFVLRNVFAEVGGFPQVALMEDVMLRERLKSYGRPRLLAGPIGVSSRRWRKVGPIRQTLRNWRLMAAYWMGTTPDRLAESYPRHDT